MARFPARPADALTGSQFVQSIMNVPPGPQRETLVTNEILRGNFPNFMRNLVPITETDKGNTVIYKVTPNFLCIGDDTDYLSFPLTAPNAQKVADTFGCILPTSTISDQVWKSAKVKLTPEPLSGRTSTISGKTYTGSQFVNDKSKMIDTDSIEYHQQLVQKQFNERGGKPGDLVSGQMKDVVISNQLLGTSSARLGLHGLHTADGKPIQGGALSVHNDQHIEYAMGIRLVDKECLINGKPADIMKDILQNPQYAYLLNGNEGQGASAVLRFTAYNYQGADKVKEDESGTKPGTQVASSAFGEPQPPAKEYQDGKPPAGFRPVKQSEVSADISGQNGIAQQLLNKYRPVMPRGSTIPFNLNGQQWIGRLELHDHPPLGPHTGLTVYRAIDDARRDDAAPTTEVAQLDTLPTSSQGRVQLLNRINDYLDKIKI